MACDTIPGALFEITTCGCDPDCGWGAECRNPLYALDHPTECGGVLTVTSIYFDPPLLRIPQGRSGAVRLIAVFDDGRLADVSAEGVIVSDDPGIAASKGAGIFDGIAVGLVGITGAWGGLSTEGEVSVFDNACADSRVWDVVVVMDDGGYFLQGYSRAYGSGSERVRPALRRFVQRFDYATSPAVLSLQLAMNLGDNPAYDLRWGSITSGPRPTLGPRTGQDRIWDGSSWSSTITLGPVSGGGSNVGAALLGALQHALTGRPEARKVIILFSTGGETKCTPGILGAATTIKAAGVELAVVTPLSVNEPVLSYCNYPELAYTVLARAASPCLFVGGTDGGRASNVGAMLLSVACSGCSPSSGSGVGLEFLDLDPSLPPPPNVPPPPPVEPPVEPPVIDRRVPVYDPIHPFDDPVADMLCSAGGTVVLFESKYVWGLNPDEDPTTILPQQYLDCAVQVLNGEIYDPYPEAVKISLIKWKAVGGSRTALSGLQRVGDNCDGQDNVVAFGSIQYLAVQLCIPKPAAQLLFNVGSTVQAVTMKKVGSSHVIEVGQTGILGSSGAVNSVVMVSSDDTEHRVYVKPVGGYFTLGIDQENLQGGGVASVKAIKMVSSDLTEHNLTLKKVGGFHVASPS